MNECFNMNGIDDNFNRFLVFMVRWLYNDVFEHGDMYNTISISAHCFSFVSLDNSLKYDFDFQNDIVLVTIDNNDIEVTNRFSFLYETLSQVPFKSFVDTVVSMSMIAQCATIDN